MKGLLVVIGLSRPGPKKHSKFKVMRFVLQKLGPCEGGRIVRRLLETRGLLHRPGKGFRIGISGYSTVLSVSVTVMTPITSPFSLTKTHFENLTRGISAFAGIEISTIGGGGSIIADTVMRLMSR